MNYTPKALHSHYTAIAKHSQRGVALAFSLIMLLVMTLIGVTAMQSTTMAEKMVGNQRDRSVAFQAAESALREGGATNALIDDFTYDGTSGNAGLYAQTAVVDPFADSTWTGAIQYAGTLYTNPSITVASAPLYVLQYRGALAVDSAGQQLVTGTNYGVSGRRHALRTISRATGLTTNTNVFLQSDIIILR